MTIIDAVDYPDTITIYGQELRKTIAGKYPYACISQDKHPRAMIYQGNGCWEPALLIADVKKIGKYDRLITA